MRPTDVNGSQSDPHPAAAGKRGQLVWFDPPRHSNTFFKVHVHWRPVNVKANRGKNNYWLTRKEWPGAASRHSSLKLPTSSDASSIQFPPHSPSIHYPSRVECMNEWLIFPRISLPASHAGNVQPIITFWLLLIDQSIRKIFTTVERCITEGDNMSRSLRPLFSVLSSLDLQNLFYFAVSKHVAYVRVYN